MKLDLGFLQGAIFTLVVFSWAIAGYHDFRGEWAGWIIPGVMGSFILFGLTIQRSLE